VALEVGGSSPLGHPQHHRHPQTVAHRDGRLPWVQAPLAQRQSNGLLIRRFWVRIPGGAPRKTWWRGLFEPVGCIVWLTKSESGAIQPRMQSFAMATVDEARRFAARVDCSGEHYLWLGRRNPQRGTGKLQVDGKQVTAHRYAWELARGAVAPTPLCSPVPTRRCASGSST
jgi:hypothetical protein